MCRRAGSHKCSDGQVVVASDGQVVVASDCVTAAAKQQRRWTDGNERRRQWQTTEVNTTLNVGVMLKRSGRDQCKKWDRTAR